MEVVASLSQGRTAAAHCGLFTHKSVPVIFEPPCTWNTLFNGSSVYRVTCWIVVEAVKMCLSHHLVVITVHQEAQGNL